MLSRSHAIMLNQTVATHQKISYNQDEIFQNIEKYVLQRTSRKNKPKKKLPKLNTIHSETQNSAPSNNQSYRVQDRQDEHHQDEDYLAEDHRDEDNQEEDQQEDFQEVHRQKKGHKEKPHHKENNKQKEPDHGQNQLSLPSKRTYQEQLKHVIQNKASFKRVSNLTPEEHVKALKTALQLMNELKQDSDRPPYFVRMSSSESIEDQVTRINKKEQEIHRKVQEEECINPILLPHSGRLSEKDRKTMVSYVDYNERRRPKEAFMDRANRKEPVFNQNSFEDSDILYKIPELLDQSSQIITKSYPVKLRHKDDFEDYYQNGLKRLEEIRKGPPFEAYKSLETFNEANFCSFKALDANYYRSMDKRNEGFTGCLQIDQHYANSMPFDELFPQLGEMFGFPERQNYDLEREEEEIMKEEEDLRREEEQLMAVKEAENIPSIHILNNNGTNIIEKLLSEGNKNPNKYKHDYDTLPMPEKHLNWLKERFETSLEQIKSRDSSMAHYNPYSKSVSNKWDYFIGLERFQEEKDVSSFYENQSRTKTMPLPSKRRNNRSEGQKVGKSGKGKGKDAPTSKVKNEIQDHQSKRKLVQVAYNINYNECDEGYSKWKGRLL